MKFEVSKDVGVPALLVILAGIMGIVGFFVVWLPDMTGMQLYEHASQAIGVDQWKLYIPLFIAIISALVLIISIPPLVGVRFNEKIIAGEFILMGLIGIILMIIFGTTNVEEYGQFFGKAQVGFWLGMIFMVIVTIVGLVNANAIRKA